MQKTDWVIQEQPMDDKMEEVMQAYVAGDTAEALRLYDLYFEDELANIRSYRGKMS